MKETLTPTSLVLTQKRIYTINDRPVHMHHCLADPHHDWECDSPYCEVMTGYCPEHGGFEPIAVGREPWRGR